MAAQTLGRSRIAGGSAVPRRCPARTGRTSPALHVEPELHRVAVGPSIASRAEHRQCGDEASRPTAEPQCQWSRSPRAKAGHHARWTLRAGEGVLRTGIYVLALEQHG